MSLNTLITISYPVLTITVSFPIILILLIILLLRLVVYTLRLVYTGVGLTYKLTVIDIHGIKFAKTATLRPQTAYSPLYTPFTFIG